MNEGWKCPQCGRVYAPSVTECGACNGSVKIDYPNPNSPTVAPHLPYVIPNTFPAEPQREWVPWFGEPYPLTVESVTAGYSLWNDP